MPVADIVREITALQSQHRFDAALALGKNYLETLPKADVAGWKQMRRVLAQAACAAGEHQTMHGEKARARDYYQTARNYAEAIVKSEGRNAQARILYGVALVGCEEYRAASRETAEALKFFPRSFDAHMLMAEISYRMNSFASCRKHLDLAYGVANNKLRVAAYLDSVKVNDRASLRGTWLKEQVFQPNGPIPKFPNDGKFYEFCRYRITRGAYQGAERLLEDRLRDAAKHPLEQEGKTVRMLAEIWIHDNHYGRVDTTLCDYLRANPSDIGAQKLYAQSHIIRGNNQAAQEHLAHALLDSQAGPNPELTLLLLRSFLTTPTKDTDGITFANRIVAESPDKILIRDTLKMVIEFADIVPPETFDAMLATAHMREVLQGPVHRWRQEDAQARSGIAHSLALPATRKSARAEVFKAQIRREVLGVDTGPEDGESTELAANLGFRSKTAIAAFMGAGAPELR